MKITRVELGAAACLVAVAFWLGIDPSERAAPPELGRDDCAGGVGGLDR
jgi:hypothetical protein